MKREIMVEAELLDRKLPSVIRRLPIAYLEKFYHSAWVAVEDGRWHSKPGFGKLFYKSITDHSGAEQYDYNEKATILLTAPKTMHITPLPSCLDGASPKILDAAWIVKFEGTLRPYFCIKVKNGLNLIDDIREEFGDFIFEWHWGSKTDLHIFPLYDSSADYAATLRGMSDDDIAEAMTRYEMFPVIARMKWG